MTNPQNESPANSKATIEILETNIVRKYRIIAFVTKENNPSVIMFNGNVTRLKMGFTIRKRIDKTIPPMMYVVMPPLTITPCNICATKYSAAE